MLSPKGFERVRYTVKPRFDEMPRDWGNWFVISRVRYIEVLFHTLRYYWAEKYRSLYRGLRYIEVPLYKISCASYKTSRHFFTRVRETYFRTDLLTSLGICTVQCLVEHLVYRIVSRSGTPRLLSFKGNLSNLCI